jgi:hypothetical protein
VISGTDLTIMNWVKEMEKELEELKKPKSKKPKVTSEQVKVSELKVGDVIVYKRVPYTITKISEISFHGFLEITTQEGEIIKLFPNHKIRRRI